MPKKSNKKINLSQRYPFLVIPAILLLILFFLTIADLYYQSQVLGSVTKPNLISFTPTAYPLFSPAGNPIFSANGVVILDSDNQKIIFEKNSDVRFAPASTLKIMTALTALNHYNLDDVLTVSDTSVDSEIGLKPGEKFKFIDLLYAMMLPSDNRAAQTIAANYPGGVGAFVSQMNENARQWNLDNTHFADPTGLDDSSDYTTPHDLATLGSIAMQNPILSKVADTTEESITDISGQNSYDLDNLNRLLNFDGVVGLKTGHTDEAKDVLVTAKNEQGHRLIMVVMNSDDRFADTLNLLDFIRGKITFQTIHPE